MPAVRRGSSELPHLMFRHRSMRSLPLPLQNFIADDKSYSAPTCINRLGWYPDFNADWMAEVIGCGVSLLLCLSDNAVQSAIRRHCCSAHTCLNWMQYSILACMVIFDTQHAKVRSCSWLNAYADASDIK